MARPLPHPSSSCSLKYLNSRYLLSSYQKASGPQDKERVTGWDNAGLQVMDDCLWRMSLSESKTCLMLNVETTFVCDHKKWKKSCGRNVSRLSCRELSNSKPIHSSQMVHHHRRLWEHRHQSVTKKRPSHHSVINVIPSHGYSTSCEIPLTFKSRH